MKRMFTLLIICGLLAGSAVQIRDVGPDHSISAYSATPVTAEIGYAVSRWNAPAGWIAGGAAGGFWGSLGWRVGAEIGGLVGGLAGALMGGALGGF